MSDPLETTFQFLAKTENAAARDILAAGLECSDPITRLGALRAILDRRDPEGHREVFRRLTSLDKQGREIVAERSERLVDAARDALSSPNRKVCAAACDAIASFHLYQVIPALVAALVDTENPHTDLPAAAILKLTEAFYEELSGVADRPKQKAQDTVRARMTTSLEEAVRKYHRHERLEPVEALLLVAKQKNAVLRQLLQRTEEKSHPAILEVLSNSSQGGVIRLLLGFLEDPQMPRAVTDVICNRCDAKFVDNITRTVGTKPSRAAIETLKRFESIAWAKPGHEVFNELDDDAQEGAVWLLMFSSLNPDDKLEVVGYLLLHGKIGGRRAAAKALAKLKGPRANELAVEAVEDDDPQVRATIIPQLRSRKIPGALSMLIGMVDSTDETIHEALRTAMPEFTFRHFLSNFDAMPEAMQPVSGHLVSKIDSGAVEKLTEEMSCLSPVRRRKAVQAAFAMGLVGAVEKAIATLLSDEDHMVRIAAAKALADSNSMPSWEALRDALLDRSVIVQEAAERSLEMISRSLMIQEEDEEGEAAEADSQEVAQ